MRGYYRAVKRGEKWAVKIHRMTPGFGKMLALYMRTIDMSEMLTRKDSLFNLLPKEHNEWRGGYIAVPITFGEIK